MASGRWHPSECWSCGKSVEDAGHISASGLCEPCGTSRELANVHELRSHSGPFFRHWRTRIAASVGAVLVDEQPRNLDAEREAS